MTESTVQEVLLKGLGPKWGLGVEVRGPRGERVRTPVDEEAVRVRPTPEATEWDWDRVRVPQKRLEDTESKKGEFHSHRNS